MSFIPFTFNKVQLQVVTINGKEWCRAKEVCKALEYREKTAHIIRGHCSTENITQKYQLSGVGVADTLINWPSDLQKYDLYINEEGLYELVFSSQQPLAKGIQETLLQRDVPAYSAAADRQDERSNRRKKTVN